jgi:predicted membrane-bound mannosyltransferase
MSAYDDNYYPDPAEREELRDEDAILTDLMAEYMLRREAGVVVIYPELLARAEEFGERVAANFETLVVYWELKRLEGEA